MTQLEVLSRRTFLYKYILKRSTHQTALYLKKQTAKALLMFTCAITNYILNYNNNLYDYVFFNIVETKIGKIARCAIRSIVHDIKDIITLTNVHAKYILQYVI